MKQIKKLKFFTVTEVQNVLNEAFNYKIGKDVIRRKANLLSMFVKIDNVSFVPEEFLEFFPIPLFKREEKAKIQKEINNKIEKFKKIIEEFEKEN